MSNKSALVKFVLAVSLIFIIGYAVFIYLVFDNLINFLSAITWFKMTEKVHNSIFWLFIGVWFLIAIRGSSLKFKEGK